MDLSVFVRALHAATCSMPHVGYYSCRLRTRTRSECKEIVACELNFRFERHGIINLRGKGFRFEEDEPNYRFGVLIWRFRMPTYKR